MDGSLDCLCGPVIGACDPICAPRNAFGYRNIQNYEKGRILRTTGASLLLCFIKTAALLRLSVRLSLCAAAHAPSGRPVRGSFGLSCPRRSLSVKGLSGAVTTPARGPAKTFRGTIHRMVPLLCLLTFSGGTLRVPFGLWGASRPQRGPSPFVATRHFPRAAGESPHTPSQAFEKA